MGVIKRGILGGFSGKVANVVGTSWKGIEVIKAMPLSVRNPNTILQQNQRASITASVKFFQMVGLDVVRALNNRWAVKMSGFNACVKRGRRHFGPGNELSGHVKCISDGSYIPIATPIPSAACSFDGDDLSINLGQLSNYSDYSMQDKFYVVASNQSGSIAHTLVKAGDMSEAQIVPVPADLASTLKFVWISILKADGSEVTDSVQIVF